MVPTTQARAAVALGGPSLRLTPDCAGKGADVLRSRAAAAADDVDQAVLGELAQGAARVLRLLVVRAHLVRQARVRMTRDPGRGDAREILDERAHLRRAEGAVDADDERVRVLDGQPERIDRLAGEVAAAAVDRREGDPERDLGSLVQRGGDRSLGVELAEDAFESCARVLHSLLRSAYCGVACRCRLEEVRALPAPPSNIPSLRGNSASLRYLPKENGAFFRRAGSLGVW